MACKRNKEMLTVLLVFLLDSPVQMFATNCGRNCKDSCCNNGIQHTTNNIPPDNDASNTWQLFQVWYFWVIMTLCVFSCCGVCSYYRRKHSLMMRRRTSRLQSLTDRSRTDYHHLSSFNRLYTAISRGSRISNSQSTTYYTYVRPSVMDSVTTSQLPPSYAEVVSKPEMYPVNNKSESSCPISIYSPQQNSENLHTLNVLGLLQSSDRFEEPTCDPPAYSEVASFYNDHQAHAHSTSPVHLSNPPRTVVTETTIG